MGRGALALGTALLEASRLPIVFDLDETLLVAYSLHTLDVRLEKLRDGCCTVLTAPDSATLVPHCLLNTRPPS